jgi:copper(I)-binding protein
MRAVIISLVLALAPIFSAAATAHETTVKGVTIADPWARATPAGATTAGAFFEMRTEEGVDDRLIAARSPVAGTVEIHNHITEGGIVRMRRVDGIAVPGGKSVTLAPGGYHIMLMDLKDPLNKGETFRMTLVFEKAGEIEVEASIEPIAATGPPGTDQQPK